MNIFLVIEETNFFHPEFLFEIVKTLKKTDKLVGAAVITKVPNSANLFNYLIKNWRKLFFREMFLLSSIKVLRSAKSIFNSTFKIPRLYTVKHVLEYHNVSFFSVENNINSTFVLETIRNTNPDIILNSGSLIFKEQLLSIPSKCVMNRHSSLLPSFGGLVPLFHALRLNQPLGATIHIMERKIDSGAILAQKSIKVEAGDTLFDLYNKPFIISAELAIKAVNKIRNNDLSQISNNFQPSYFSWPTDEDWTQFRKRKMKWI